MLENLAAKLIHNPEKDAALRHRLAIALAEANDKLGHAREVWSEAVADEAEDKGTPGASDKAEKALTPRRQLHFTFNDNELSPLMG